MKSYGEIFTYEDKSGKLIRKAFASKRSGGAVLGMPVGAIGSHGYLEVRVLMKLYLVHRIIWQMHFGDIPKGMQIDHIDGNRTNNRIENLRMVSNHENHQNMKLKTNNKSGINGVRWNKLNMKWKAEISVNGKSKSLGEYSDIKSACEARIVAEVIHGYHRNHGRRVG